MHVEYLVPGIKKIILDNGLRILLARGPHTKKAFLMVGFKVGSIDETEENFGIFHFLEHILFKSTKTRKGRKILEELEEAGTKVNAETNVNCTVLYAKVLPHLLKKIIGIFFEMIANPSYNSREFQLERKVVLEEFESSRDDPLEYLVDFAFFPTLFKNTPLAHSVLGAPENLLRFSKEDLERIKLEYYVPGNMIIVVMGRFDEEEVVREIEATFGGLAPALVKPQKLVVGLDNSQNIKLVPRKTTSSQVYLCLGYKVPGSLNRDFYRLSLLDGILSEGMSSRLFVALREKRGIGYGLGTVFGDFNQVGTLFAYLAGFNKKRFNEAVRTILEEFRQLRDKRVNERELRRAKNQVISSHDEAMERIEFWAGQILRKEFFEVPYDFRRFPKNIERIKTREILEAANQYLIDDYILTALVPEGFSPF